MSTTYQDTFTEAAGPLTGHVADSGFGTWGGPVSGGTTLALSSNRVTLAEPGTYLNYSNVMGNTVAAYTSSADAYFDISVPAGVSDVFLVLVQYSMASYDGYFGFDVDPTAGSGGGLYWDIYGLDGYWGFDESNPPGMAIGSAFRFGIVHDVVAGTVRPYSEPYGGGTRTYLGAAQPTAKTLAGVPMYLFASFGSVFSGGYLDNLTIVTENATAPADPTTSTVALGAWSGAGGAYIGHTATATLTAKDSSGNPITSGGETVVFGGTKVTAGATTDVGNGTYTATITAATAGAATVSATIGGVTVSTTMPTATVLTVPTATSTAAMSPSTNFYVGRTATVTLTTPDGVGGLTVVFGTSGGASVITFGAVTDVGNGTYTATMTAVTGGTATTLTATIDGETVTGAMPSVTVLVPPATVARGVSGLRGGALSYTATGGLAGTGADGSFARTTGLWATNAEAGKTYALYSGTTLLGSFVVTSNTTTTLSFSGNATGATTAYADTATVTRWAAARQYALRFALGGAGRWQRFAVVHGATVSVSTSDVNYFALYALRVKGQPVKQRTDTF